LYEYLLSVFDLAFSMMARNKAREFDVHLIHLAQDTGQCDYIL